MLMNPVSTNYHPNWKLKKAAEYWLFTGSLNTLTLFKNLFSRFGKAREYGQIKKPSLRPEQKEEQIFPWISNSHRDYFQISFLFFQEHLFLEFSQRLMCSKNRYQFSKEGIYVCSPNKQRFSRRITDQHILSPKNLKHVSFLHFAMKIP